MAVQPLSPDLVLPWNPDPRQEERFYRWSRNAFIAILVVFIVVPFLPVLELPLQAKDKEVIKTKVFFEKIEVPNKPKPKPKPKQIVKPKPKPKPIPKPKPKKGEKPKAGSGKKIASKGKKSSSNKPKQLSAISAELNALKGLNIAGIKKKKGLTKSKGVVATADRNILGENRAAVAKLGSEVVDNKITTRGGTSLAAHELSDVGGEVTGGNPTSSRAHGSYVAGQRDMESIRRVLEQKKSTIYAIYNEALASYPELQGKFIFQFIITPEGSVKNLKLVSSELSLPTLERNILSRIRTVNFGPEDVSSTSVEYKFVFFPS